MYKEIENIIFEFYKKAINDFLIGYHFKKISDFKKHIPHIAIFWHNRLNPEKSIKSNKSFSIINAHKPLMIKKGEVDRWVILFRENLNQADFDNKVKQKWLDDVDHLAEILKEKLC